MLFSASQSAPAPLLPTNRSLFNTSIPNALSAQVGPPAVSMPIVKEKDSVNLANELDICLSHIQALVVEIEAVQERLREDGGQDTLTERKATLSRTYRSARSKLDRLFLPEEAEKPLRRGNKSKLISPSIRPETLPDLTSTPDHINMLLSTKSNHQNIIDGTQVPGVSYPSNLATNLTSKRTSHKIAEQGRRNRINTALAEMQTLLPKHAPGTNDQGDDGNSKAFTVEAAIRYIKSLQKEAHGEFQDEEPSPEVHAELPQARPEGFEAAPSNEASGAQTPKISTPPFDHLNIVPGEAFTFSSAYFSPLASPDLMPELELTSGAYFSPLTSPGLKPQRQGNEKLLATEFPDAQSLATSGTESDSALVYDGYVEGVQTRSGRVSKARKGTQRTHVCACGKVSTSGG